MCCWGSGLLLKREVLEHTEMLGGLSWRPVCNSSTSEIWSRQAGQTDHLSELWVGWIKWGAVEEDS